MKQNPNMNPSSSSSQSFDPSQFNHQQQQQLSYYNSVYPPQQQQQQCRPPIYPPGVQLPNQQTDVLNPVVAVVAAALVQNLTNLATVYPQPVIAGPHGFGSASFPGHVSGPSALVSHAGQSLDEGGVKNRGGQNTGGGRDSFSNFPPRPGGSGAQGNLYRDRDIIVEEVNQGRELLRRKILAGVTWCEVCKVKFGKNNLLKHKSGRKHRRNLIGQYEQKHSADIKQDTAMKPDSLLAEEETKKNLPEVIPSDNFPHRPGGSGQSLQGKGHNRGRSGPRSRVAEKAGSAGVNWCEVCKVKFGKNNLLKHMSGRKHRRNLIGQYEQKHSGDIKQDTAMKPDSLLAEEEIKKNLPEVIPSDTLPTQIKLVHEQKINDVQQADSLKDADPDILAEKPMLNQPENQRRGKKRLRKQNTVEKEKRQLIEPPKPKVVPSLMCDLCNFGCERREYLMGHLLSKQHKSKLKRFEGPQARIGLQALYPPTPVTQTVYHFQGVQQIFYGAQVSIPTAGTSILPRTDKAAPSTTSWVSNFQQNPNPQVL